MTTKILKTTGKVEGKELLFPSIPECIKKVDVEKGEVTAHIMPGLLDLAK